MTSCRTCLSMPRESAREAAELWTSLIPNSHVERITELSGPNDPILIDCVIGGTAYQILGAPHMPEPTMASSFTLTVPDQAALDRVWDGFLERGGEELECAWIKDPFGFYWQVVPDSFATAMASQTPVVQQAAVEQIWQMRKVDVSKVETAIEMAAYSLERGGTTANTAE